MLRFRLWMISEMSVKGHGSLLDKPALLPEYKETFQGRVVKTLLEPSSCWITSGGAWVVENIGTADPSDHFNRCLSKCHRPDQGEHQR